MVQSGAAVAAVGQRAPWAQQDANAAESRANLTDTSISTSTVADLALRRSITVAPPAEPTTCDINAPLTPVLADGSLFVLANNTLARYSAATGARQWQITTDPYTPYSHILVAGGLVIIGGTECAHSSAPYSSVDAYRETDGGFAWFAGNSQFALDSMVVSGAYVVFGDSYLHARTTVVRLADGSRVWSQETARCSVASGDTIVVAGEVIRERCLTNGTSQLEGDNLPTGATLWHHSGSFTILRGDNDTSHGAHVYVTAAGSGTVTDIDAVTGATRFVVVGATDVLAVDRDRVYADCGQDSLCAYSVTTGNQVWQTSYSGNHLIAVANNVVYNQDAEFDAETGAYLAFDIGFNQTVTQLLVGGGYLIVVSNPRIVDIYS